MGLFWYLVELESPTTSIYTQRGEWAAKARHARHQIATWRQWLKENVDYARKPPPDGLGLIDIEPNPEGVILIGRRSALVKDHEWQRKGMRLNERIWMTTYDGLLDATRSSEMARAARRPPPAG